ncbi:hypothetical protein [Aquabacterium sp. J223]|uniref:hypothetical protein n=1 Tax=Aquabacterium sp. J223 TaxID=2898431 RepID=UPI0021AD7483|nr:hypothetical protein [Aquabacterium sp. J223]UUX94565.1 hypothetical protein LRS07_14795 [Aquabacterium sp. J223]
MRNLTLINHVQRLASMVSAKLELGHGNAAVVFHIDEDRVLKLTSDPANSALLSRQASGGRPCTALPFVHEDLGVVAQCEDHLYRGFLLERLRPAQTSQTLDFIASGESTRQSHDPAALDPAVDARCLRRIAAGAPWTLAPVLRRLAGDVAANGWLLDRFDNGNVMERSDGTPVLSDLVYAFVPLRRPQDCRPGPRSPS